MLQKFKVEYKKVNIDMECRKIFYENPSNDELESLEKDISKLDYWSAGICLTQITKYYIKNDNQSQALKASEEAIKLISQYSFPYLKFCHILIADASGDAAVVEWGNNKLNFIRKGEKNYLTATNFNITETANPADECFRYSTAEKMLKKSEPSVELFKNILSLTHVEGKYPTVYSNVCDLKNQKLYLYNFHNYSYCKEIDLNVELLSGEKQYMIRSFFPVSTAESMFRVMNDCIDNFDNVPTCKVTFKIDLNKPFLNDKLYVKGSAKELGDWD